MSQAPAKVLTAPITHVLHAYNMPPRLDCLEPSCPLTYIQDLMRVRFRNSLPDLSSLRRPMGCFASKPDVPPPAMTTVGGVVSQRQSSPVVPQATRAPLRSSQRSRANSGHRSPPVKEVSMREWPRSNSTPQKWQPSTVDEDLPPIPSHSSRRRRSRNTSTPVRVGECYRRWSA